MRANIQNVPRDTARMTHKKHSEFWHKFRGTACTIKFILLEKLIVSKLVKKFLTFYGPWRFFLVLKRALQWTPSKMKFSPHFHICFFKVLSNSVLSSISRTSSALLSSGFATKILCPFSTFPRRATRPAYLILLDSITVTTIIIIIILL